MEAIIVDSITKEFGPAQVVKSLSFKVKKGSIHGFLGPNGAGKTTTMKIIAGVIPATSGHVYISGQNIQDNLIEMKKNLGVLLENPPLYLDMEVREYLEFVCKLHKVPWNKVSDFVSEAILKLNLQEVEHRLIGNLSKGFKQRVGVAQAIVFKPEIVILDEPTVGLDPSAVIEMRKLIQEIGKDHTVLLSSHLLHEISLICDEVTIISHGVLQATGTVEEIAKKVQGKNKITALVKGSHLKFLDDLNHLDFVDRVTSQAEDGGARIDIFIDSVIDHRETISNLIRENKLIILEFTQDKMNLEKIFLEYTGGN